MNKVKNLATGVWNGPSPPPNNQSSIINRKWLVSSAPRHCHSFDKLRTASERSEESPLKSSIINRQSPINPLRLLAKPLPNNPNKTNANSASTIRCFRNTTYLPCGFTAASPPIHTAPLWSLRAIRRIARQSPTPPPPSLPTPEINTKKSTPKLLTIN
jgi:hypothetical protein